MEFTPADRRLIPDRRSNPDRRRVVRVVVQERRSGTERRGVAERRGTDAPADHIHNALRLLSSPRDAPERTYAVLPGRWAGYPPPTDKFLTCYAPICH